MAPVISTLDRQSEKGTTEVFNLASPASEAQNLNAELLNSPSLAPEAQNLNVELVKDKIETPLYSEGIQPVNPQPRLGSYVAPLSIGILLGIVALHAFHVIKSRIGKRRGSSAMRKEEEDTKQDINNSNFND